MLFRPLAFARLLAPLLACTALAAAAQERMLQLDLGRGGARLPLSVTPQPQALATLILLPGGDSGSGKIIDGKPTSGNFLSRSRELFAAQNFNVIVVYRASDLSGLDYGYRIGQEHIGELQQVVAYAKAEFGKPVWLIGTSRGTVSATAATIALGAGAVQGLVLTSSVTGRRTGAIGSQDIASIKVPTLVVHHRNDACRVCVPAEAARIPARLTSAPVKKFILVEGGSDPQGDPCEARHWHGYINYEQETVKLIADWIRDPQG